MLTFLIVESDAGEAENLIYYLRFVRESFFWVSDMQTAFSILMACSIHLDALITSLRVQKTWKQLNLESFGGVEIAREAQLYRPGLPVFFFTKRGTADHERIKELPFDVGLILRPARLEDVFRASDVLRNLKRRVSVYV